MEVGMALQARVRLPLSNSLKRTREDGRFLGSPLPSRRSGSSSSSSSKKRGLVVTEAKGKKGMMARQFQRPPPPPLPKMEDDGNPKFVIFIRTASVYLWYPLSLITGGTTAKIMVAAKDNFLGKYIYKDTIARNIAAVIYRELIETLAWAHERTPLANLIRWRDKPVALSIVQARLVNPDEKEIQKTALKQHRVLRSATGFRYGYKLVENNNLRAALSTSDVIELPTQEELKTVLDKVKDFFGNATSNAKESFGKLTSLGSLTNEESETKSEVKS